MKHDLQPENFDQASFDQVSYDHVEKILHDRQRRKDAVSFKHHQAHIVNLAMLAGAVCIVLIYFLLPISRIASIRIEGTKHLNDAYIRQLSGITTDDRYYLTIPILVKNRIEEDPLIASVDVKMKNDRTVMITIEEKKIIGYRYIDHPEVVLGDGTVADLKSEYLDLIADVPLITGFTDDGEVKKLASALAKVKPEVIEDMAEIDKYALSYDPNAIKVLMRSGGYFISSTYSIANINSYNDVYAVMADKSNCLFSLDDAAKVASQVCPWNEEAEEYWTDAEGNFVLNSSGEKAVKHYYTDKDGKPALDGEERKIAIPINEQGDEVKDADFQAHYDAGYYVSGTLTLPEGQ